MARRLLLALLLSGLAVAPARAHDLPDRISMHAFVRPEGDRLAVLVLGGLARSLAGRWARGAVGSPGRQT
jgi:hypothetical protein